MINHFSCSHDTSTPLLPKNSPLFTEFDIWMETNEKILFYLWNMAMQKKSNNNHFSMLYGQNINFKYKWETFHSTKSHISLSYFSTTIVLWYDVSLTSNRSLSFIRNEITKVFTHKFRSLRHHPPLWYYACLFRLSAVNLLIKLTHSMMMMIFCRAF